MSATEVRSDGGTTDASDWAWIPSKTLLLLGEAAHAAATVVASGVRSHAAFAGTIAVPAIRRGPRAGDAAS